MTASELKKSILQMAVEGKLTEQSKKDEPVEKLLKRIKEEKESLIKEGKIKKENTISEIYKKDGSYYERVSDGKNILKDVCIDDELPFEIPDSWAWVRLANIFNIRGGKRVPKGYRISKNPTEHIYIRVSDMKNNTIVQDDLHYISNEVYELIKNYTISKDDLYLTIAGTIGKVGTVPDFFDKMNLTENAVKLTNILIDKYYLLLIISSSFVQTQFIDKTNKVAQPKLAIERILTTIIPLPPIEEQKRIAEKINLLMPLINEYYSLEKNITKLNKEFPNSIKKSILQYAIEGKLTEQSEKDEPVEKLLKRIKKEREKLIKEGKIKKDKTTSEIYKKDGSYYERITDGKNILKDVCIDDELPFDIPDSWAWVNVADIANIYTGNSINENEKKTKYMKGASGYCYIATKDVGFDNIINYDNGVKIPNTDNKFRIAPKNSVLLCIEGGSAGRKISVTDKDVCFGNKLCCFVTISVNVFFLYYYLQSPVFHLIFKENINGIIGGVSINKLKQLKIPLPPIEEQGRIVDKINRVNEVINTIKL